jgi:hypothetical protein
MSKEFSELKRRIDKLRSAHLRAFQYFYAYDTISELRAPNLIGEEEAHNNAEAIGLYKGFMNPSHTGLMTGFYVELAKVFDFHKDAIHLNKLLNYAEQNQKKLNVDAFAEFNEGRLYIEELKQKYEGMKRDDLLKVKSMLDDAQNKIERLKNIRDKQVVHIDVDDSDIKPLTYEEIESLLLLSHEVLNIFSAKTNHETSDYQLIKQQVVDDTKELVALMRKDYQAS